ncbi:hypothetical protein HK100_002130 [Physocladia obscura]|uniref:Uncharacterized protein n=1 Tax=Physocladia obscura TaxID=109957 RepID=A0AAD5SWS5_9FUNG|nr:hypothetical protein HK100_002130 [Physocladia obscura]
MSLNNITDEIYSKAAVSTCIISAGISFIASVNLIWSLCVNKSEKKTPAANITLIVGNLSMFLYSMSYIFSLGYNLYETPMMVIHGFTLASAECCYIYYSWARGGDIVRRLSKLVYNIMNRIFAVLLPTVVVLDLISIGIYLFFSLTDTIKLILLVQSTISETFFVAVDLTLVLHFIMYLKSIQIDGSRTRTEFILISQYGIISCSMAAVGFGTFGVGFITADSNLENILIAVSSVFLSLQLAVLVVMKLHISWVVVAEKIRRDKSSVNREVALRYSAVSENLRLSKQSESPQLESGVARLIV